MLGVTTRARVSPRTTMENYRALYKVPAKSAKQRGEKRENALREQKKKREDTFFERRNIQSDEEAPASSSAAPLAANSRKNETRREKLLRWKAEKDKLVAQQKLVEKKRPPFKVGVAHHAIDPNHELVSVRATALKCTTAKKAAADTRADAAVKHKAKPPTAAATSLAALSAAAPKPRSPYSGRVTRSRTAAVAVKTAEDSKVKKTLPRATSKAPSTSAVGGAKNFKAPAIVTSVRSKATTGVKSNTKPQNSSSGSSKAAKADLETSFAPKDYKFKAPVNLTLPRTPLALKRKAAGAKEANWPHIAGVSVLSKSPSEPSPKIRKSERSVASQRRGTLSRTIKERTPKKSPKVKAESDTDSPKPKTRRSQRRTGSEAFVVTEMPELTSSQAKEKVMPSNTAEEICEVNIQAPACAEEIVQKYPDGVVQERSSPRKSRSRRSMGTKKLQRGKENVPEKEIESCDSNEDVAMPLSQTDIEPIIVSSRRMSIHEPSPPVNVSPEKLSNGMVPAQFSPFITSARGKDKYSIQKRRSSLIPIVPELPPEELARSRQTEHFRNLLERESSRLLTLSAVWEERRSEAPPAVQDKILGPVGQARLLVKDKFQQFRRLVDKFEAGDPDGNMTADDLTGFWEMVLLTVENVDKRFKELEDQKDNNWEEIETGVPVKKTTSSVSIAAKAAKPRTQVQSRLKDIIEAARKKRLEKKQNKSGNVSNDVTTFDGGFFKVESPKNLLSLVKTNSPAPKSTKVLPSTPRQFHRRSLLQQVLTNSAVRAQNSPAVSPLNKSLPLSPSPKVVVAQMRASELGKRMSMDSLNDSFTLNPSSPVLKSEPTKSILKSARRSIRVNTPRNRVAFENINTSLNSSPGSPLLLSPAGTPTRTPVAMRTATPGSRKRASLIPRPISTPKGDRCSLSPVRESLAPSKPLLSGDLIDFDSPKRGSIA